MGGGGVILYVKENLKAKVLHKSNTAQPGKRLKPKYLFCAEWEGNAASTLVILVYRPDKGLTKNSLGFSDEPALPTATRLSWVIGMLTC